MKVAHPRPGDGLSHLHHGVSGVNKMTPISRFVLKLLAKKTQTQLGARQCYGPCYTYIRRTPLWVLCPCLGCDLRWLRGGREPSAMLSSYPLRESRLPGALCSTARPPSGTGCQNVSRLRRKGRFLSLRYLFSFDQGPDRHNLFHH